MSSRQFLDSVEKIFDEASAFLKLSYGISNQIKLANATYTVRFGVRLRKKYILLQDIDQFIQTIESQ